MGSIVEWDHLYYVIKIENKLSKLAKLKKPKTNTNSCISFRNNMVCKNPTATADAQIQQRET